MREEVVQLQSSNSDKDIMPIMGYPIFRKPSIKPADKFLQPPTYLWRRKNRYSGCLTINMSASRSYGEVGFTPGSGFNDSRSSIQHSWDQKTQGNAMTVNNLIGESDIKSHPLEDLTDSLEGPMDISGDSANDHHEPLSTSIRAILLAHTEIISPITMDRSAAMLESGRSSRLIDLSIQSLHASGITKIYVPTQYASHSLHAHIQRTYPSFGLGDKESFVQPWAAHQTKNCKDWFKSDFNAIVKLLDQIPEDEASRGLSEPSDYLILPGHVVHDINLCDLISYHRNIGAEITVCAINHAPGNSSKTDEVFIMNNNREVLSIVGNMHPNNDEELMENMNIYVAKKQSLLSIVSDTWDHQSSLLSASLEKGMNVSAYEYSGSHWLCIDSVESYFKLNMETIDGKFKLPTALASPLKRPPTFHGRNVIEKSTVGDGAFIANSHIQESNISEYVQIYNNCTISNSVLLSSSQVLENAILERCIVQENAVIGKGCIIRNTMGIFDANFTEEGYVIQSGIVIILKNAIIGEKTVI
jgi:glucose-1-phosphate adenylyltransferase